MKMVMIPHMKQRVYVETTIVSYLTARPSRDLIVLARQELTRQWWKSRKSSFDLFISQYVLDEAASGDNEASSRRLEILSTLPVLPTLDEATSLAAKILNSGAIPQKAATDALHISMAAVHAMDVLMTWNCRHIANTDIIADVGYVIMEAGYEAPLIYTPQEMMGR